MSPLVRFCLKPHTFRYIPSVHTKTLSFFGETASISKLSRKWVQMKTHTYHLRVDNQKRIEMKRVKSSASCIQASWPCEIKHGVSSEHVSIFNLRQHTRFIVFERFSVDSWKRYENGSVDADRSMHFQCHRKRSQMETHWCGQGLKMRFKAK